MKNFNFLSTSEISPDSEIKLDELAIMDKISAILVGKKNEEGQNFSLEEIKNSLIQAVEVDDYWFFLISSDPITKKLFSKLQKKSLDTAVLVEFLQKAGEKMKVYDQMRKGKEKSKQIREKNGINMDIFKEYLGVERVIKNEEEVKFLEDLSNINLKKAFSHNKEDFSKLLHFCTKFNNFEKFKNKIGHQLNLESAMNGNSEEKEKIKMEFLRSQINKEWASILEVILYQHIELSDWLGEETKTYLTSSFDDFKNGVDFYVEFEGLSKTIAFAVDVTFSSSFDKKIMRMKDEIDKNQLAKIDYYLSESSGFMGRKNNIPRFIVAVDYEKMKELNFWWITNQDEQFAKSNFKYLLLDLILVQCKYILDYLKNKKNNSLIKSDQKDNFENVYQEINYFLQKIKDQFCKKDKLNSNDDNSAHLENFSVIFKKYFKN